MEKQPRQTNKHHGQKLPPSAKLFIGLSTAGAFVAAAIIVASAIVFAFSERQGLVTFGMLFWPLIVALALAFTLSVNQLLRGVRVPAVLPLTVACVCLALTVAVIIAECAVYGTFYLDPFTTP